MLTEKEQLILLLILKKGSITYRRQKIITSVKWFNIMANLEKNDLIVGNFSKSKNNRNERSYKLTSFGISTAMHLSKLENVPKYLKNNRTLYMIY